MPQERCELRPVLLPVVRPRRIRVGAEDPGGIIENCSNAGSGERECIFGAVRDILNNNPSDIRSKELCKKVDSEFRSYCTYGIGSIVGTYYSPLRSGAQHA